MAEERTDLRIGELLIEAQVLRSRDLQDAMKIAKLTSLPLGRVLIMSSYVNERDFRAGVKAQSMVRDSILPLSAAVQSLKLMSRTELTFEEALNELGWAGAREAKTNKLGEMLFEAGIVTQDQMDTAIRTSESTGLPLGRVLVSLGLLSNETLTTALNTQILIRDGKVARDEGIKGLRTSYERRLPLELTLHEKGFYRGPIKPSIRLGELFILANLVSPLDVMNSLEHGLMEGKPIGKVFVERQLISDRILDAALSVQEMVANRTLDSNQAAEALSKFAESNAELDTVLSHLQISKDNFKATVRLHDLLRVAGALQHSDIELIDMKDAEPSSADAIQIASTLLDAGLIDKRTYTASLRCYFLVASGWMNIQQGIIALNYLSHEPDFTFDEVLLKLDWIVRTRPAF